MRQAHAKEIDSNLVLGAALLLALSCSPRDFLTRRLATDLISASDTFKTPQQFTLQTGTVANKDYVSPEYIVLQQHGWISATKAPCSPGLPPPCWDVLLTPAGVETVRALIPGRRGRQSLALHSRGKARTLSRDRHQQARQRRRC